MAGRGQPKLRPDTGTADTDDPVSVARVIVLAQLTAGPRTRDQLAKTLTKRGVPEAAAEQVLDRMTEVGLIDDQAYADQWVSSRSSGRGLARRALRHELAHRGVDSAIVAEALEQIDDESEYASATDLVARKLRTMGRLEPEAQVRRLVSMLARKGYPSGLAYRVVREQVTEMQRGGALEGLGLDE
jgi:regulatory protein